MKADVKPDVKATVKVGSYEVPSLGVRPVSAPGKGGLHRTHTSLLHAFSLLAVIAAILAASTARAGAEPSSESDMQSEAPFFEGEDALGHRLILASPPQRIVSLAPNLTEILFAIGAGPPQLVGVTRFCNEPAEADSLPKIGGFADPSQEVIRALDPDLVLATRGNPRTLLDAMAAEGLPVYAVAAEGGIGKILDCIRSVGEVTGRTAAADSLATSLEERIESVASLTRELPDSVRPRVYFGPLDPPLWTAGRGTHIDDLIRLAGGLNIAFDAPAPWVELSLESIVISNPQVIVVSEEDASKQGSAARSARTRTLRKLIYEEGWRDTDAALAERVCVLDADWVLRPGPRVVEALEAMVRCFHPEHGDPADPARAP